MVQSKIGQRSTLRRDAGVEDASVALRALRASNYDAFKEELAGSECRLCPLGAARQHIVVDRGTPGAQLMLVGEAPGKDEDAQGVAFVGRSGRLLDAMLEQAGWNPQSDVIIANVVKCRPPDNRPPQQKEVDQCLPFLHKQIELLKPKQVGLLGATAVKHVLGDKRPMNQLVGKFLASELFPDEKFTVLFHPAFILRSPSRRSEMVGWLKSLRERRPRGKSARR